MSKKEIAKGTFTVEMKPESQEKIEGISFGRFIISKVFEVDLEATSKVEMLTAGSDNGSAAYVAIEHIQGNLKGKSGAFVLTHVGTMNSESQKLEVNIVPGCGTGELSGIEGKLTIDIVNKVHYYTIEYSFK